MLYVSLGCSDSQVKVYNLMQHEHGADDVLVMGTDGLWDVLSNQEVAEAVTSFLANCDPDDLHRLNLCLIISLSLDIYFFIFFLEKIPCVSR